MITSLAEPQCRNLPTKVDDEMKHYLQAPVPNELLLSGGKAYPT